MAASSVADCSSVTTPPAPATAARYHRGVSQHGVASHRDDGHVRDGQIARGERASNGDVLCRSTRGLRAARDEAGHTGDENDGEAPAKVAQLALVSSTHGRVCAEGRRLSLPCAKSFHFDDK